MHLHNTHRPTHWFFNIDHVISNHKDAIAKTSPYLTGINASMAKSMVAAYKAELDYAEELKRQKISYITVRATNYISPAVDLFNALAKGRFVPTTPHVVTQLENSTVTSARQLDPCGAYYDFENLKDEINARLEMVMDANGSTKSQAQGFLETQTKLSKKFSDEVSILNKTNKQGVIVVFNEGMAHDYALKATTQELVLRALT